MHMRRWTVTIVVAGALFGGWALPATAFQNDIYIENNGVDMSDSAAGADNVQVSLNPGNSNMISGPGAGNAERLAVREGKERKERGARNNVEESGEAAPVETAPVDAAPVAPPAEGDYQAFTDTGYTEPVTVPQEVPQETPATADGTLVRQLPSTGTGIPIRVSLAALSAIAALGLGAVGFKRRMVL
jgi:hypothetical protein